MEESFHEPVMVEEICELLITGPERLAVDCTLGGGGHAEALLSKRFGPGRPAVAKLLGIDQDPEALEYASRRLARFGERVVLKRGNFERLKDLMQEAGMEKADAILMDLGPSRRQLTSAKRGFSLKEDGPLDMRMDPESQTTAAELVNRLSERELMQLLREYGEERNAKRIAREIVRARGKTSEILTTGELRAVVERAARGRKGGRIHPATRTFMALRIAVNRELEALERALSHAAECLNPGGRIAVISYHSLEDRMVKRAFARESSREEDQDAAQARSSGRLRPVTKKPIRPSAEEIARNPSARSAKLRVAERTENRP